MIKKEKEILNVPNDEFFSTVCSMLDQGKDVSINPKGNSMMPFIRSERDVVVLSPAGRDFEVGDILLFNIDGRYILHRLIGIDGDRFTMMGDGNVVGTETCSRDDVLARVTKILRNGKTPRIPSKGRLWRFLKPFRRYILGIYRRVKPSDFRIERYGNLNSSHNIGGK